MNASEIKLQQIIEGEKQYVVPLFQRTYSWEDREWKILWNDLLDLYEQESPRPHFIGSVVTIPTTSVPEGVAKYLLIDGQQRLTTIFVLLMVMRDQVQGTGHNELAEEIHNTLLINPYKKGLDKYKLLPTQNDRVSFQGLVEGKTSEKNDSGQIAGAYDFFKKQFKKNGYVDITKLKKIITSFLSLVSIVLDPNDNPHLVFESLNAKGRPLTQADLIRNYFFMRIHVEHQDENYGKYWLPMQSSLGDNLTEYIRHFLMMDGGNVSKSDVYFDLKDKVTKDNSIEYLKKLSVFSKYYKKLLCPEQEDNTPIRIGISRLNRIEVTVAYPFLLKIYDLYNSGEIDEDIFYNILKVIENFMIRRFVCAYPTNALNKIFPPLYNQIIAKNPENMVDGLKSALQSKGYPRDNEFSTRIQEARLYGAGGLQVKTKLLLQSIEESYAHKECVDFENLTIEHVLPQTITDWWKIHIGEDWEEVHELLLHTLGNLTLTAYNSELSNADFDNKRKELSKSHLEMNKYFGDSRVTKWRGEDIKNRAASLSDVALKIWPYFGEDSLSSETKSPTGTKPVALWILGQKFPVKTWRDVLEKTMLVVADIVPEKFEKIITNFPKFIGRDSNKFREFRDLNNGIFIEVNLSADAIQRFCQQAIDYIDLTAEDWRVETSDVGT